MGNRGRKPPAAFVGAQRWNTGSASSFGEGQGGGRKTGLPLLVVGSAIKVKFQFDGIHQRVVRGEVVARTSQSCCLRVL